MKARHPALVGTLLLLLAVGFAQPVYAAIFINKAELNNGQLRVDGGGAVPNHSITVDGAVLGSSDNNGSFSLQAQPFSSATCKVTVSDGTNSVQAPLAGCTPSQPPPAPILSSLTLNPPSVVGGNSATGTVSLSGAASSATSVSLSSSNTGVASVPAGVSVAAGATSASFTVTTTAVNATNSVTISASSGGVTKSAVLTATPSTASLPTIITAGLTCTSGVCQLGPGNVGTFFAQFISESGGQGPTPFRWNLIAGRLPDSLTLNDPRQCGVHCVTISGTPNTVQTTTFTVQVQDGVGATAQQDFSITINPPRPLVITTPSYCCPPGTVGASYSVHFFADGGVQPFTWSLAVGQFPPGLRLDPSGLLSGTPTAAGTFTFTVRVTDNAGAQATGQFSITIS